MRRLVRFSWLALALGALAGVPTPMAAVPSYPDARFNIRLHDPSGRDVPLSFRLFEVGDVLHADFQGPSGPPQNVRAEWDGRTLVLQVAEAARFVGDWDGERFHGKVLETGDAFLRWDAEPAPVLDSDRAPRWGRTIPLFDGRSMAAWEAVAHRGEPAREPAVEKGVLALKGGDVATRERFDDFRLHLEYRLGEDDDSGVYLRGRYEIQLRTRPSDMAGERGDLGALYGFLAPARVAGRKPGVFHTLDATLIGRRLWVVIDGVTIHDGVIAESITGDARDADEAEPGPIVLQGRFGAGEFRNVTITPAR